MFTKSSVSQALIDATKSIMEASDKKLLLEPSKKMPERLQGDIVKKNDDKAAASGNAAEVRESDEKDSPFNWRGKPSQIPKKPGESAGFDSKKISTGTVYTKKYKKDKEEMKEESEKFDALKHVKNPTQGEKDAAKDVKRGSYADRAAMLRSAQADGRLKEEHEDAKEDAIEDKKIVKAMVKKSALKDDESKESKKDNEKKEMSEGRHMSDNEMKEREHIVKSMKKGMKGFKDRYGDRAKNVMYATATKQAMKEEVESLDEGKMDKMSLSSLWHQHAHHAYGADQGYGGGEGGVHSKHAATAIENHVRKHHGNKCADDMCDHSEHHVAANEYVGSQKERDEVEAGAAKLRKKHGIEGHLYGMHESVTEALKGKQTKLDKNHNGKLDSQDFQILRKQKNEDIGGISTMSEKKKEVKEAQEAEYVRMEPNEDMKTKTVDGLAGRKKVGADYHNQTKSYKLKLNVESSPAKEGQIAAGGGTPAEQGAMAAKYEKKKEVKEGKGTDVDPNFVTNESTPMKMAKDLAKKSFKKIRTETLGMAGATSEENKKW